MRSQLWRLLFAALLLPLFAAPGSEGFADRCDGGEVEIRSWDSIPCPPGSGKLCPEDEFVTSPGWPKHYPEDLRCRYKLIGRSTEKVRLDFIEFNVEGLGPLCKKDFLDVHIQLTDSNASLATTPLLGRFCGHTTDAVPRTIVSQHSVLVMDFYSDKNTQRVYNNDMHMKALGFKAKYTFVPRTEYEPGHQILGSINGCSYLISAEDSTAEEGTVMSATYPGLYPDNLHCVYIFQAKPNQRVRLVFEDFDLYEIARKSIEQPVHTIDSCPVDVVRFFNSREQLDQIQGDFCGTRPNLTIFSTGPSLRLDFTSGVGRVSRTRDLSADSESAEIQRRGFRLRYTMSHKFLRIDSRSALMKHHLNGTECDFLIESSGKSQEQLLFPPVRPGTMCRLFLQGVHNRQRTEVVEVELTQFAQNTNGGKSCRSARLSAYMKGQGLFDSLPDSSFCQLKDDTAAVIPTSLRSEGPQMFLELRTPAEATADLESDSGDGGSRGFMLRYRFITDYGIPGIPVSEDRCEFTYHSSKRSRGLTNSPLFNGRTKAHYPNNITCLLRFIADRPTELVRIRFTHFYVEDFFVESLNNDKRHHSTGSYVACTGDRVELFDIYELPNKTETQRDLVSAYCGTSIPGPYVSHLDTRELQVRFVSTWDKKPHELYGKRTATGFQIEYDFPSKESLMPNHYCGGKIMSPSHGGIIKIPRDPKTHQASDVICEWHIYPNKPDNKVFVQFPEFHLEGSTKSCSMAVVRIYRGNSHIPSSEICGSDNSIPAFYGEAGQHVRLRLITTRGSRGGRGLKFAWTEVLNNESANGACPGFRCNRTRHCIDHRLECNRLPNCGTVVINAVAESISEWDRWRNYSEYEADNSDEDMNCLTEATYQMFHVGIGVVVTVGLIGLLLLLVLCRQGAKIDKADSGLDLSVTRRLVAETQSGGAGGSGGIGIDDAPQFGERFYPQQQQPVQQQPQNRPKLKHQPESQQSCGSTSTMVRERMQKISIV